MRGYVGPAGQQVHYRRAGESGPAVVLFHESPQSSWVYERALPALGRTMRVWALDTPGYGLSDPPPAPLEIPDYAELLLRAIDELGIDRFAAVGQHTGASIAIEVARQARPRATQAVLSGVALLDEEERQRFLASWAPDIPFDGDGQYLQDLWARYVRLWEGPPELLHLGVTNPMLCFERYNWAYNAAFRYDPAPALAGLDIPVLLLTAERDMLAKYDDAVADLVDDVATKRLTDTTGQLAWRVPDDYADVISWFLGADEGRS